MRDLDLTSLRIFVLVCDHKSIKKVAENERIDPSGITKRLAKLEADLQTALLKRTRQGVEATPEGTVLCEKARHLVLQAQRLSEDFAQRRNGLSNTLVVASHMGSVTGVLTDDLADFKRQHIHAELCFQIKEALSKDAVQMVRDDLAHLAVIWDNTETSGLQHADYYHDQLVAVMHKDHSLSHFKALRFEEHLLHEDLISDKHTRHTAALLGRSLQGQYNHLRFVARVESQVTALRLAACGIGVYVCQARTADCYRRLLDFTAVPLTNPWANTRVKIIFSPTLKDPVALSLIEHLSQRHC